MKSMLALMMFLACTTMPAFAQETPAAPVDSATNSETSAPPSTVDTTPESKVDEITSKARDLADKAEAKAQEIALKVNQDERAQKAAEGLLGKIYLLAESLNFSSFHWVAFALMATGVVSFALQLALGKLVLLFHGSLNIKEICSDAVGFVISTVGLVLTTQAAAENSEFTHSPAAVLSAAIVGVVVGFTLYRWGQHQELNAVKGKTKA